jgi:hypothetical protein
MRPDPKRSREALEKQAEVKQKNEGSRKPKKPKVTERNW